jgi:site-specific recombinase XerD
MKTSRQSIKLEEEQRQLLEEWVRAHRTPQQVVKRCQIERRAVFLFESNRLRPYSTRRVRQIIHQYAAAAGIEKRVYPHLFRHQIITFLTRKGIISPKLQLLSGHAEEKSLAIYRDLALADVSAEYEQAMRSFPVR